MTLEEVILAAENGNIDAMLALGKHFFEEDKIGDSAEWFERAADSPDATAYAIAMAVQTKSVLILTGFHPIRAWKEAYGHWNKVHNWCIELLERQDITEHFQQVALSHLVDSLYWLGYTLYRMDNFDLAMRRLEAGLDMENDDIRLLYGACMIESDAAKENAVAAIEKAYPYLRLVETKQTGVAEDIVYLVLMLLALIYREGDIKNIPKDMEASYRCVQKACELPDTLGERAKKELAKYKKGLFGGLVYKG